MEDRHTCWREWKEFFASRSKRPLPSAEPLRKYRNLPPSLAESLAIFQLGESGGGTVIEQARFSKLPQLDDDYADAMALFVREEHRHADILALCVSQLGGQLITQNWTAKLFVMARRLIGLRLKVLVLLAAEVVGICYYYLIARQLPVSPIRDWLEELVSDEQSHLDFHCDFLRTQTDRPWKRAVFVSAWRITMLLAAIVVMIDHRKAMRDLRIDRRTIWQRWMTYSRLAERLVTRPRAKLVRVG
ncbi:MAG: ferritin-like domain-containing protein [Woeseiaceae bacterium]|nr:ferritin-like domain-containing protein [Woeseiaceae bacterium]